MLTRKNILEAMVFLTTAGITLLLYQLLFIPMNAMEATIDLLFLCLPLTLWAILHFLTKAEFGYKTLLLSIFSLLAAGSLCLLSIRWIASLGPNMLSPLIFLLFLLLLVILNVAYSYVFYHTAKRK